MKLIISLFLLVSLVSCAQPKPKIEVKDKPAFSIPIADPEVETIVRAYFELSTYNHIRFKNFVTIGFSEIKHDNVIGLCTYGRGFREIDLDKEFWKRAKWPQKVALVYHEMTHCYCQRDHDFDDGKMYPDNSLRYLLDRLFAKAPLTPLKPEGYLDDGCPKSIMHPIILESQCFEEHYQYYAEEMFARCKPF